MSASRLLQLALAAALLLVASTSDARLRAVFLTDNGTLTFIDPFATDLATAALRGGPWAVSIFNADGEEHAATRGSPLADRLRAALAPPPDVFIFSASFCGVLQVASAPGDAWSAVLRAFAPGATIVLLEGEFLELQLPRLESVAPDVYVPMFDDAFHDPALVAALARSNSTLFTSLGASLLPEGFGNFVSPLLFQPCVLDGCDWVLAKELGTILSGSVNTIYPLRLRFQSLIAAGNLSATVWGHPGFNRDDRGLTNHQYNAALERHWVALIGKREDYTLTKYLQALASRCLVVGDVPNDGVVGAFVVPLSVDSSDDEILSAVSAASASVAQTRTRLQLEIARYVVLSAYSSDAAFQQTVVPAVERFRAGLRGPWARPGRCFPQLRHTPTQRACTLGGGKLARAGANASAPLLCCVPNLSNAGKPGHPLASTYLRLEALAATVARMNGAG